MQIFVLKLTASWGVFQACACLFSTLGAPWFRAQCPDSPEEKTQRCFILFAFQTLPLSLRVHLGCPSSWQHVLQLQRCKSEALHPILSCVFQGMFSLGSLLLQNKVESHTQNWVWFVLSVEKEAPAQMGILKSVPMDLWTSWPSFKTWCHQQKAGPGEKPVHRESNLEACVPLLIIIFLLGRCQVGFWDNPSYETCIAGFIFKKAGKNKPILMWSFITRNEAFL